MDIEPCEASSNDVSQGSGRNAKIVAITAIVVAAAVVVSVLAFTFAQSAHPTTPHSSFHLDVTVPPPNLPPYSVVLGFTGFTRNVTWSDVRIELTDGVDAVSWSPATEGLSGSAFVLYCCGTEALGSMTVTCNVTDVLGDGIPLTGDTINLTATSDSPFIATQNYTLSALYVPNGGLICSLTFNGTPLVVSKQ